MARHEMIGWVVGLFLAVAFTAAAMICVVEAVVLRPATDLPPLLSGN